MRPIRSLLILVVALAGGAMLVAEAEAQYPYGNCGFYLNRNGYSDLALPYFSQFPPVYYSHPVARPYGWSPYAYPPTVLTPGAGIVEPAEIINPFVKPNEAEEVPRTQPKPETKLAPEQSAVKPLMILNPYVTQEEFVTAKAE